VFTLLYIADIYETEKYVFESRPNILEEARLNAEKLGVKDIEPFEYICKSPEEFFLYWLAYKRGLKDGFERLLDWLDKIRWKIPLYNILDDWLDVRRGVILYLNAIEILARFDEYLNWVEDAKEP
jgi:hypothetical protein